MPTPIKRSSNGASSKPKAATRVVEDGYVLTAQESRKIPLGILIGAWWISFYECGKKDNKDGDIAFQVSMALSFKGDGTPNTYNKTSLVEFKFPKEGNNIFHLEFLAQLLAPYDSDAVSKDMEISDFAIARLLNPTDAELGLSGDDLLEAEELSEQVYKYAPVAVDLVEAVSTGLGVRDEWNTSRATALGNDTLGTADDPHHSQASLKKHSIAKAKLEAKLREEQAEVATS